MKIQLHKKVSIEQGLLSVPLGTTKEFSCVSDLVKKCEKKNGGYIRVELSAPLRPRTTGVKSQNHRINGFVQQIAQETGEDFDVVKRECKNRAYRRGYPMKRDSSGQIIVSHFTGRPMPESETNITIKEASLLIEEIQQLAAELGILLREE